MPSNKYSMTHAGNSYIKFDWVTIGLIVTAILLVYICSTNKKYSKRERFDEVTKLNINQPNKNLSDIDNKKKSTYFQRLLLHNNRCSPSCCSPQWPVPFKLDNDLALCNDNNKYIPTKYYCTGQQGRGCVCVTEKQHDYLGSRGTNCLNGFVNQYRYNDPSSVINGVDPNESKNAKSNAVYTIV